jgi:hypothetical protein
VGGTAVGVVQQVDGFERLGHPTANLLARQTAQRQWECHVFEHRHVRPECVVLKNHRARTLLRPEVGDVRAVNHNASGVGLEEPGDHPQGGRLSAPRRPEQGNHLAGLELQAEVVDDGAAAEVLCEPIDVQAAAGASVGQASASRAAPVELALLGCGGSGLG